MSNVVLIMDQYKRFEQAEHQHRKIDPGYEANKLNELANVLGQSIRRMAIVNEDDRAGFDAYKQARYQLVSMNGRRPDDLLEFMNQMQDDFAQNSPEYLLVVTNDPMFRYLLEPLTKQGETHVKVWMLGQQVKPPFDDRKYHARLYSEIIPEPKIPKLDVRLDYENLHIGLKQRGWQPNAMELIEAVRKAVADIGDVVKITAYADWGLLSRTEPHDQQSKPTGNHDWQRDLAAIGVETAYLVNQRGKNTADMKIAGDIRDLLERNVSAPDAVDVVVIGTNDRDFRVTVEKARERGQRLIVLAIRDGLSQHLRSILQPSDIRYIDDYLKTKGEPQNEPPNRINPAEPHTELLIKVAGWLRRQGTKGWTYASFEQLAKEAIQDAGAEVQLQEAIKAGVLYLRKSNARLNTEEVIEMNCKHPLARAIRCLVQWAPEQVNYGLQGRGLPYLDTKFMCMGMQRYRRFQELGVRGEPPDGVRWLNLLAKGGVLVKESHQRNDPPYNTITTWRLPTAQTEQQLESSHSESLRAAAEPELTKPTNLDPPANSMSVNSETSESSLAEDDAKPNNPSTPGDSQKEKKTYV